MKRLLSIILAVSHLAFVTPVAAESASFSDVPASSPYFQAVEALKANGILSGYADGTFRPNVRVNRAEAAKIIVGSTLGTNISPLQTSVYDDVPADAWFAAYVEAAHSQLNIVDGPPKSSRFRPQDSVRMAEFLKMFLLSQKIDVAASYAEIRLPLASDANNASDWFYPYVRYALSASMLQVQQDGTFGLNAELTRGDVSLLIYRYLMYKENRRTQALLSMEETELVNVVAMLDQQQLTEAERASARALLAARGALLSRPDAAVVKGAVKIAEAFRSLVRGYTAGFEGQWDEVIRLSKETWNLADQAHNFSSGLSTLVSQVQAYASAMATEARARKGS